MDSNEGVLCERGLCDYSKGSNGFAKAPGECQGINIAFATCEHKKSGKKDDLHSFKTWVSIVKLTQKKKASSNTIRTHADVAVP